MAFKIITISRQFGSGGRSIGKELAARLGIPFYDKELVNRIAIESGLDPAFVEEQSELTPTRGGFSQVLPLGGISSAATELSTGEYLWRKQREVILNLAANGPCVIVGRFADCILKEHPDCLNVFVHAGFDFRADRIVRLYGVQDKKPHHLLAEKDKKRGAAYHHFTGAQWGLAIQYHLTLDTEVLGISRCVDLLASLATQD